jgi:hypothetical protein
MGQLAVAVEVCWWFMAIEDALQAILDDWPEVEPLLTVAELEGLAAMSQEADAMAADRLAGVFLLVAAGLPTGHVAWQRLRGQRFDAGQRDSSGEPLIRSLAVLARTALANPGSEVDAEADALAEEARRSLLHHGAVPAALAGNGAGSWLAVRFGGEVLFPQFQFASMEPYEQFTMVARLFAQVGAEDDPWGAVAWWLTPNPWLLAAPASLLGTEREPEIAYAADQLANDSW